MARTPVQRRSAARRDALIAAAADLLIAEGPGAVTHRRVAAAAGVPAGSAPYYFPTQRELYVEAVRAAEALRSSAARATAEALTRRRRPATATAGLLLEVLYAPELTQDVVRRRLEPMLQASADPDLQPIMAASRPALLEALRTTLRHCGWADVADSPDFDLAARMLDAGLLYSSALGEADPVSHATEAVARLLELVRSQSAGD